MPAFLARRWRQQPQFPVELDRGHPLVNEKLMRFFVTRSGTKWREHVLNKVATPSGFTAPVVRGMGQSVVAGLTPGGSNYLQVADDASYSFEPCSLFWSGQVNSASAYRQFVDKCDGSNITPYEFRSENGATAFPALARNTGGVTLAVVSTMAIPIGRPTRLAVASAAGSGAIANFFVDGKQETIGWTSVAATPTTAPINIGRRQDGGVQLDGLFEVVIGWNTLLESGAFRAITENPWQVLRPLPTAKYFAAPSASGFFSRHYYDRHIARGGA